MKSDVEKKRSKFSIETFAEAVEKHGASIEDLSKKADTLTKDVSALKKTQEGQQKDIEAIKKDLEAFKKSAGKEEPAPLKTETPSTEAPAAPAETKTSGSNERFAQRYYADGFYSKSEAAFSRANGFTEDPELVWLEFSPATGVARVATREDLEFEGIITPTIPRS